MEHLVQPLNIHDEIDSLLEDHPNRFPKVGSSLGPHGDTFVAGTLGGYVSIDGPREGRYALTNHHVVFSTRRNNPQSVFKLEDNQNGHEPPEIQQPASRDLKSLTGVLE
jgi:hypothetical protein